MAISYLASIGLKIVLEDVGYVGLGVSLFQTTPIPFFAQNISRKCTYLYNSHMHCTSTSKEPSPWNFRKLSAFDRYLAGGDKNNHIVK